jgi:hypothetical protein
VCRFDLAIDIQPDRLEQAGEIKQRILQTAVLRWRKAGPMLDLENGTYWVKWEKGQRRYSRNLVLYGDRHNRFTGEVDCVHLELRFLRPNTIRKQGIHFPRDLLKLNPKEVFNKHVAFSNAGMKYAQEIVRRHVKEDIEKQKGRQASIFVDRYREAIHRRIAYVLRRTGQDRAQTVKDRIRTTKKGMPMLIPPMFDMPCSLCEGDGLKSLRIFSKEGVHVH